MDMSYIVCKLRLYFVQLIVLCSYIIIINIIVIEYASYTLVVKLSALRGKYGLP